MKLRAPSKYLLLQGVFPRRIRRGLIEAQTVICLEEHDRPNFRGEFAAASLKLSGCYGSAICESYFRGEFAAASLKLRVKAHITGQLSADFRGEFAAASLKRKVNVPTQSWIDVFPRRIRRGLIEAALARRFEPFCFLISAANSPRPH